MDLPWVLTAYAQKRIRSDWSHYTKGDLEWAEALALAIDRFARDWIAANCSGRALTEKE